MTFSDCELSIKILNYEPAPVYLSLCEVNSELAVNLHKKKQYIWACFNTRTFSYIFAFQNLLKQNVYHCYV